ncbi:hypothetical protein XELAEV_18000528mg [Xenopus laevis]|uniref:Secreted protein n=1 Tax=Xenopus laevis TaxID=8355 RepID=A0A974BP30_XENLA|nr:hypothetical protein XELAEV_18000528mg [Xenopus laevis]
MCFLLLPLSGLSLTTMFTVTSLITSLTAQSDPESFHTGQNFNQRKMQFKAVVRHFYYLSPQQRKKGPPGYSPVSQSDPAASHISPAKH